MSPLVCVNAKNNRGVSRPASTSCTDIHPQIPLKTRFFLPLLLSFIAAAPQEVTFNDTGPEVNTIRAGQATVTAVADEPGRRYFALEGGAIRVGDAAAGIEDFGTAKGSVSALTLDPGGGRLAAATSAGTIQVFDTKARRLVSSVEMPSSWPVEGMAMPGDGSVICLAADNSWGRFLADPEKPPKVMDLESLEGPAALSASGAYVCGVNGDGDLVLWDVAARTALRTLRVDRPIKTVAASPTNRFVAYSVLGRPGEIGLWGLDNDATTTLKSDSTSENRKIGFDRNENILAAVDAGGLCEWFNIADGRMLSTVQMDHDATSFAIGSTGAVYGALQGGNVQIAEPRLVANASTEPYYTVSVHYCTNRQSGSKTFWRCLWDTATGAIGIGVIFFGCFISLGFALRGRRKNAVRAFAATLAAIGVAALISIGSTRATEGAAPRPAFNSEIGNLRFGVCDVTVPRSHKVGRLESPPSWWVFQMPEQPEAHIVFDKRRDLEKDDFLTTVQRLVNESDRKDVLVFIHGFNVTFEDAARRTAQIAVDLNFKGAPLFFSWPSCGDPSRYFVDGDNAEASVADFSTFLKALKNEVKSERIHLIAHSMGNRVLLRSLQRLRNLGEIGPHDWHPFGHIILAAPDVDRRVFLNEIAPDVTGPLPPLTLYCSSQDSALALSKRFNGDQRVGDSVPEVTVFNGIETVDATLVDTSLFGDHSYFGGNRSVLTDIFYLLQFDKAPQDRFGLHQETIGSLRYWRFSQ